MKNYAKTGGKKGKPGYRTPSNFISRQKENFKKIKIKQKHAHQSKGSSRVKNSRSK